MTTEIQLPVFDSMQQCHAVTGIPLATLRRAKKAGCNGFQHGRVALRPVLEYLFAQGGDVRVLDAQDELARAKTRLADHKLEVERNSVIPKADVTNFIRQTFSPVRENILQMPSVLSAKLATTDPLGFRQVLQEYADQFLKTCREHLPAE